VTAVAAQRQVLLRQQVEEFLYAEAALLDAWDLDDWLLLFDDNCVRLAARVTRLNNRRAHREYPHSRTNHQVFNVRVRELPAEELSVTASFTVWRFRAGRSSCYVGKYRYRLRRSDDGFRIAAKRAELDMTDLRSVGDVAIIL